MIPPAERPRDILRVGHLTKHFAVSRGFFFKRQVATIRAVDDVSFAIPKGQTLALVGEDGSGKSLAGRLVLRLDEADSGRVDFDGVDLFDLAPGELRAMRAHMQLIAHDAVATLSPRLTALGLVTDTLLRLGARPGAALQRRSEALLHRVGLDAGAGDLRPAELTPEQLQRLCLARGIASGPSLLVCDESIAALDPAAGQRVMALLRDIQAQDGLTCLFITASLGLARAIADRVAVMYMGRIVESGDLDELIRHPRHPYSQALVAALPDADPQQRTVLAGKLPSALRLPPGCPLHPRCPFARELCRQEVPALLDIADRHEVACHLVSADTEASYAA